MRLLTIIYRGRYQLYKCMGRVRKQQLLSKSKSLFDPVYTVDELNYLL